MGYVVDLTNAVNGIRQISLLFSTSHKLLAKTKNFPIYFPLFPIRSDLRDTMDLSTRHSCFVVKESPMVLFGPTRNVERVIGSIRRDCLDHVIVLNKGHLQAILKLLALLSQMQNPLRIGRIAPNQEWLIRPKRERL